MDVLICSAAVLNSAPARTVLLERIRQQKPDLCSSDEFEGDLTGDRANTAYILILSETLFQSICSISLQPFFLPPICSYVYFQKIRLCTMTFMGVGKMGRLVMGMDVHSA